MPWSIFTQGGGKGAAVTWAQNLEKALGIPVNATDTQFIYDWELAEGGGGKYNPLNQGPVPGHPELTSTGQQYGGGAADYVSWQAGITGAVDYLNMPNFQGIKKGLQDQNYGEAKSALVASPWAASHYGGGANFPNTPAPGAGQLATDGGSISTTAAGFNPLNPASWLQTLIDNLNPIHWIEKAIGNTFKEILQRLGLILLGGILVTIGIYVLVRGQNASGDTEAFKEVFAQEQQSRGTASKTAVSESNAAVEETAVAA